MQKNKISFAGLTTLAALALSACGGGGGDAPAPQQPGNTAPPPPAITVQGSAPAVSADPLALVFVPQDETSTRPTAYSVSTATLPANLQKVTAEGAYTLFAGDANSVIKLATGTVVDVAGNGEFAIGRWTNGSSNIGSVNVNQGAHYAIGRPLNLVPDLTVGAPDVKVNCTAVASTSPTSVSGNFPVGKLNSASAIVDLTFVSLDSLTLDVAIGSDAHATANATLTSLSGVFQSQGFLRHIQVLGADTKKPLLAVGYAMPTPSSGDVSGVVVLKCQ